MLPIQTPKTDGPKRNTGGARDCGAAKAGRLPYPSTTTATDDEGMDAALRSAAASFALKGWSTASSVLSLMTFDLRRGEHTMRASLRARSLIALASMLVHSGFSDRARRELRRRTGSGRRGGPRGNTSDAPSAPSSISTMLTPERALFEEENSGEPEKEENSTVI